MCPFANKAREFRTLISHGCLRITRVTTWSERLVSPRTRAEILLADSFINELWNRELLWESVLSFSNPISAHQITRKHNKEIRNKSKLFCTSYLGRISHHTQMGTKANEMLPLLTVGTLSTSFVSPLPTALPCFYCHSTKFKVDLRHWKGFFFLGSMKHYRHAKGLTLARQTGTQWGPQQPPAALWSFSCLWNNPAKDVRVSLRAVHNHCSSVQPQTWW